MARARLPRYWLFTDERLGGASHDDPLWRALARLPRGSGVVLRHYGWSESRRRDLLARIVAYGRPRGLVIVGSRLDGAPGGVHRPAHAACSGRRGRGLVTASAHNRRDVMQGFARGADLLFLSPVFATRSHPGARVLGPLRFGLMARGAPGPVLALGGMDAARWRRLRPLGAEGFGGIDFWAGN